MFCSKCGNAIDGTLNECEKCGTKLATKGLTTYDYLVLQAEQKRVYETIDTYQALGWEAVDQKSGFSAEKTAINFRRNRKIKNREQLHRLQVKVDDCFNSVRVLEKNKTKTAMVVALILGIIGTLIFGAGLSMCIAWENPELWTYIVGSIVAAIGIVPCAMAYFVFVKIKNKKTAEMNIQIEQKRDEIANLCEDAQKYLI